MTNYLSNGDWRPELVIGLVCAVGTEQQLFIGNLIDQLNLAGCYTKVIKVSRDVIPALTDTSNVPREGFERYKQLMDAGEACRTNAPENGAHKNSILACGAIAEITHARKKRTAGDVLNKAAAYVIDSLKRPEEVEVLRQVYGQCFVLIGIHAEENRRVDFLTNSKGMTIDDARALIEKDQYEPHKQHGQSVNETFHLADFFLQITGNYDQLKNETSRIVELMFGNPTITPTFDEHAMFFAFSAGLRSADLSRQVGAVIANQEEIIATGANECPRPGGGLYWPIRDELTGCISEAEAGRDFKRGYDSNRREQLQIIETIISDAKKQDANFNGDVLKSVLTNSRIRDLTEFGRVVHAEMEALLSCARRGVSCLNAHLYCTTFPCHNCAKHIVASGVSRVVYVEPYPKSKALEFHKDSITTASAPTVSRGRKVVFEPFVGVGPRRFFDVFSMNLCSGYGLKRKESGSGDAVKWSISKGRLRLKSQPISYLEMELLAIDHFGQAQTGRVDANEQES